MTGYGTGSLSLTPDGAAALETRMSMAMTAAGTRGELIGSRATGGFALAFKADALWVGAATELVDGAAGRLNASQAGVTRLRTALEGSRSFTVSSRLSLTPSVEVGLQQDGGDAETGTGMDIGGGLAFTDTVTGLSLDVRVRTLVVHQAEGFTDRGVSLSFGWDPTPSSPLRLTARIPRGPTREGRPDRCRPARARGRRRRPRLPRPGIYALERLRWTGAADAVPAGTPALA